MERALRLKAIIKQKRETWDEYSPVRIAGTRLTESDLATLEMYADEYISSGGMSFGGLMKPMGDIKAVLSAYRMEVNNHSIW